MVCRDTPIASASWPWAKPRSVRSGRTRFFIPPGGSGDRVAAAGPASPVAGWQHRDDNRREPADGENGVPAALPDGLHRNADRDESRGRASDQVNPAHPRLHGASFLSSDLVIDKLT